MAGFSELIKKFDKIRDYMRDFYVYGFKSREDFNKKSARTYDNEKRRCESYLGDYMKWEYKDGAKTSFISVDCERIPVNPLYAAWKSKSFTSNDINLHFYLLDILSGGEMDLGSLCDAVSLKSGIIFDTQTLRNKCGEYVSNGILCVEKRGKSFFYRLSEDTDIISEPLLDAVKFFQGSAPFGEIGSFIMDRENAGNEIFSFKHQYIAHTLEDGILLTLIKCIREERTVIVENQSDRTGKTLLLSALPLEIFVSLRSGRRFLCMYSLQSGRFTCIRLDYIKNVKPGEKYPQAALMHEKLERNRSKVWGVIFEGKSRTEKLSMKLYINETSEKYVLERIEREGRGGTLERLCENTYMYSIEVFDINEISPWIKTFVGRIISLEGTNRTVIDRFYDDIQKLYDLYAEKETEKIGGEG